MQRGRQRNQVLALVIGLMFVIAACDDGAVEPATTSTPATTAASTTVAPTTATAPPRTSRPDTAEVEAGPAARGYPAMIDLPGEGVLLVAGEDGPPPNGKWLYDMWIFEVGGEWREIDPTCELDVCVDGVPDFVVDAFAFDSNSGLAVLVGDEGRTLTLDPATNTWEDRGGGGPHGVAGAAMAYDAASGKFIVFGGLDFESLTVNAETWAYDLETNTWEQMAPAISPTAGNFHLMEYDAHSDRMILFGGGDANDRALGETWAYDYETDTWTLMSPATSPPGRYYSAMVYDPVGDRMILYGGTDRWASATFDDTWAYDYASNEWIQIEAPGPGVRAWHAMTYDDETQTVMLFGGGVTREKFTDDTWIFDPKDNNWTPGR